VDETGAPLPPPPLPTAEDLKTRAAAPTPEQKADGPARKALEFTLTRREIDLKSIKGWKRTGTSEESWDWFIDPVTKIGYVRMSQFTEKTNIEFDRAVRQMREQGAAGLILDLRFNPGGLLNQAVLISRAFINSGVIVAMQGPSKRVESPEYGRGPAPLASMPVVVLINQGSASASEIVSGAVQHYAQKSGRPDLLVLGENSFGKGSVQSVSGLSMNRAALKLTMQHYLLPNMKIIHRRPGATEWGVKPDFRVEMLPKQTAESVLLRRNADVVLLDERGQEIKSSEARPDPSDLLAKGLDPQLEAAMVLLQARVLGKSAEQANAAPTR
jgi:carboxyl-terminal processing protease